MLATATVGKVDFSAEGIIVRREPTRSAPMASPKKIDQAEVLKFVSSLFEEDLHARRVLSLAHATLGVIHGAALGAHAIGVAMARARGVTTKHAIKQVDRLLSNSGVDVWALFAQWIPFVLGDRRDIWVVLDWTDHDHDDHATIALNLVTSHGRATPLVWKTVVKSELAEQRNEFEDDVIERLHEVLPPGVRVTLLADRGFGDHKLYGMLKDFGFDFIIRFRECIHVTSAEGETRPAADWVPSNGRVRMLAGAAVTAKRAAVPAVVVVKAAGMKEAWCLATSRVDLRPREIVNGYGRRFTIEENFRDTKDPRYGLGLSATHIGAPARRDRLLLVGALGQALITLLGAAGEAVGEDRRMKANTVKTRTHSLFRQGLHYYASIPAMPEHRLRPLMEKFGELVHAQRVCVEIFGIL